MLSRRTSCLTALVAGLLLGLPSGAAAAPSANTFVDNDSANNTAPCTMVTPCNQINTALADTTTGGTVHVDGGSYPENVVLDGGKSLIAEEFAGTAEASTVIDGAATGAAVSVFAASTGGTIQGFTLRSDNAAVSLGGDTTAVSGNTFDSTATNSSGVSVNNVSGSLTISGNTFTDNGADDGRRDGISVSDTPVTISGNFFTNLSDPVFISGASGPISGNDFSGTHVRAATGGGVSIEVLPGGGGATPTIAANFIHAAGSGSTTGVDIFQPAAVAAGATLKRNRIIGQTFGVRVTDTTAVVSLDSDLISGGAAGLKAVDLSANGGGDVTVTNVTSFNNAGNEDIVLQDTALTLDSSILSSAPDTQVGSLTATCVITNSRGPTTTGNPCQTFTTSAAPGPNFVLGGSYQLVAGSPMIDQGNPAAPPGGTLDVNGDPRSIDGNCDNVARRDMGADEFVISCPPPVPPVITQPLPTPTPTPTPTATGLRAAALKKCKKKHGVARRSCKRKANKLPV
jgi:hypothetical protein